jgi:hypothetical protein
VIIHLYDEVLKILLVTLLLFDEDNKILLNDDLMLLLDDDRIKHMEQMHQYDDENKT